MNQCYFFKKEKNMSYMYIPNYYHQGNLEPLSDFRIKYLSSASSNTWPTVTFFQISTFGFFGCEGTLFSLLDSVLAESLFDIFDGFSSFSDSSSSLDVSRPASMRFFRLSRFSFCFRNSSRRILSFSIRSASVVSFAFSSNLSSSLLSDELELDSFLDFSSIGSESRLCL